MISYIRIDPQEKLTEIQQEISALHKLYSSQPVFGVEYTTQVLAQMLMGCLANIYKCYIGRATQGGGGDPR